MEPVEATPHAVADIFCWCELRTRGAVVAKQFYGPMLEATVVDNPSPPGGAIPGGGVYTTLTLGTSAQDPMLGLYEEKAPEAATGWFLHVVTSDAAAAVERAERLGFKILQKPTPVLHIGRRALVEDSAGAMLALWQIKRFPGNGYADRMHVEYCMASSEGRGAEVLSAYVDLFGWTLKDNAFWLGDRRVASVKANLDPNEVRVNAWVPRFAVSGRATAKAAELGATKIASGDGTLYRDPLAALFALDVR